MDLLSGIEDELTEKQVSVVLGSLWLHGTYDLRVVQSWIADRRVDGLIFARPGNPQRPLIRAAHSANLPMAFIGPDEDFEVGHELSAKNLEAAEQIARHLADLGHRSLAFAGGPESSRDIQDRYHGLKSGAGERGVALRDGHVWYAGSYYAEEGTRHAERWLALDRKDAPTAVVVGNDSMALAFMRRVLQAGVAIPEDLSVVGFDGIPEGGMYFPSLTTSRQPMHQIGVEACRSLLKQIQHPEVGVPEATHYPMELVVRESTGPAKKLG
jgi:DNA-binding LacI/PurR family transcriptional regulator